MKHIKKDILSLTAVTCLSLILTGCSIGNINVDSNTINQVNDVLNNVIENSNINEVAEQLPNISDVVTSEKDADTLVSEIVEDISNVRVDIDLTEINYNMFVGLLQQMTVVPSDYDGLHMKLTGRHMTTQGSDGTVYHMCVVQDATGCCAQGLEFVTEDGNYPDIDATITVVGEFETYTDEADGNQYIHLNHAQIFNENTP